MLTEGKTYTVSELRQILEAEAKPKIDSKIIRDDVKNNKEATEEILKQTAEYNNVGDIKRNTTPEVPVDGNKTPLDANYTVEPSKEYKDRVKAQVEGYPSVQNKENSSVKENDSLEYKGNKEFYDNREEISNEREKLMAQVRAAGLTAQHLDPKTFERETLYTKANESKMKRIKFNSKFINEADVLHRIPEDYRTDGNRFLMEDKEGTQYVIECKADTVVTNHIHAQVTGIYNPVQLQEQKDRMMELAGYKHSDMKCSPGRQGRLNENVQFGELINKMRQIKDKKD